MTITISSAFDAGNIRVVEQRGDTIDLEIVKDHMSDFHQWFHFRLAGAGGREVTLRIVNCGSAAYSANVAIGSAAAAPVRSPPFVESRGFAVCRAGLYQGAESSISRAQGPS